MSAKNLLSLLLISIGLQSCVVIDNTFTAIPPGTWRAELDLDGDVPGSDKFDLDSKLPFLFDVIYETQDSFVIDIINGSERIRVSEVSFGHNRSTGKDSLMISFPEFGSYIKAYFEEDILEGRFYVPGRGDYSIPFLARHGRNTRFEHIEEGPAVNVTGKWATTFEVQDETQSFSAIGEFKQDSTGVEGTFMTETGDYRFLAGDVIGEHLWLSCFDGSHAFLFKGKISDDQQSITGFFKSGKHYETLWEATRNDTIQLMSPDSLAISRCEFFELDSALINRSGIDLEDEKLASKALLIQIMGTWCPNCKDETNFLTDFYANKPDNLEVISFAFERARDDAQAAELIDHYKRKMGVQYDIYYGGKASKKLASSAFPCLSEVIAWPTLIFLRPDRTIHRIHTGFNGPATSEYENFIKSFSNSISSITGE